MEIRLPSSEVLTDPPLRHELGYENSLPGSDTASSFAKMMAGMDGTRIDKAGLSPQESQSSMTGDADSEEDDDKTETSAENSNQSTVSTPQNLILGEDPSGQLVIAGYYLGQAPAQKGTGSIEPIAETIFEETAHVEITQSPVKTVGKDIPFSVQQFSGGESPSSGQSLADRSMGSESGLIQARLSGLEAEPMRAMTTVPPGVSSESLGAHEMSNSDVGVPIDEAPAGYTTAGKTGSIPPQSGSDLASHLTKDPGPIPPPSGGEIPSFAHQSARLSHGTSLAVLSLPSKDPERTQTGRPSMVSDLSIGTRGDTNQAEFSADLVERVRVAGSPERDHPDADTGAGDLKGGGTRANSSLRQSPPAGPRVPSAGSVFDSFSSVSGSLTGSGVTAKAAGAHSSQGLPAQSEAAAELPSDLLSRVVSLGRISRSQRLQEVTLQLKPDFLGRVSIKATMVDGQLVTQISVENAHVQQYLNKNLGWLRESLGTVGLPTQRVEVHGAAQATMSFSSSSSPGGDSQARHHTPPQAKRSRQPERGNKSDDENSPLSILSPMNRLSLRL